MNEYISISEFLKARMPRGQLRVIAEAMGTSPSLLSALRTGRKKAGPVACRRIATYFKIPLEEAFRMAGIMEQTPDIALSDRAVEQLQSDPDFRTVVDGYLNTDSPNGRKRIAAVVSALAQAASNPPSGGT